MLIGTSGAGKSSLINYLEGKPQAKVGKGGKACTKKSEVHKVTLFSKKLNIIDTQGLNDTNGFITNNGQVASRIRYQFMRNSSTKQIDAIWMLHDA